MTRLPPVLFTCLNRYRFSHTTKQASKIIAPFEFYPELYLDRYMLINKNLILHKRNLARTLYAQLHDLEDTLNRSLSISSTCCTNETCVCSYLKYPCNNESFALANAIRVVYEYSTGCRLNPTIPKRFVGCLFPIRTVDSTRSTPDPIPSYPIRQRQCAHDPRPRCPSDLHMSPIWTCSSSKTLYLLGWLRSKRNVLVSNGIPGTIPVIVVVLELREEIRRVQNDLKQLYDEPSLKQVNARIFTPTTMRDVQMFRFDILCTPFVFMKAALHWDIFGRTSIMPINTTGFATTTTKV